MLVYVNMTKLLIKKIFAVLKGHVQPSIAVTKQVGAGTNLMPGFKLVITNNATER